MVDVLGDVWTGLCPGLGFLVSDSIVMSPSPQDLLGDPSVLTAHELKGTRSFSSRAAHLCWKYRPWCPAALDGCGVCLPFSLLLSDGLISHAQPPVPRDAPYLAIVMTQGELTTAFPGDIWPLFSREWVSSLYGRDSGTGKFSSSPGTLLSPATPVWGRNRGKSQAALAACSHGPQGPDTPRLPTAAPFVWLELAFGWSSCQPDPRTGWSGNGQSVYSQKGSLELAQSLGQCARGKILSERREYLLGPLWFLAQNFLYSIKSYQTHKEQDQEKECTVETDSQVLLIMQSSTMGFKDWD
jgi:hypothetical protein